LQAIFAPIAKEKRTKQQLILNWLERKENLKNWWLLPTQLWIDQQSNAT
jgi:hypothetical protein